MVCRGALSLKGNTAVVMIPEIDSPLCQPFVHVRRFPKIDSNFSHTQ